MCNKKTTAVLIITLAILTYILPIYGCLPQTAIEIPQGTMPHRDATYDDIDVCGPGSMNYRANCPSSNFKPVQVKNITLSTSNIFISPYVVYRDYIETGTGQVRYNLIGIYRSQSGLLMYLNDHFIFPITGSNLFHLDVKLANKLQDINVTNVGSTMDMGVQQCFIMIEIPKGLKPRDYEIYFVIEFNGFNCGQIPCTIHVIE